MELLNHWSVTISIIAGALGIMGTIAATYKAAAKEHDKQTTATAMGIAEVIKTAMIKQSLHDEHTRRIDEVTAKLTDHEHAALSQWKHVNDRLDDIYAIVANTNATQLHRRRQTGDNA